MCYFCRFCSSLKVKSCAWSRNISSWPWFWPQHLDTVPLRTTVLLYVAMKFIFPKNICNILPALRVQSASNAHIIKQRNNSLRTAKNLELMAKIISRCLGSNLSIKWTGQRSRASGSTVWLVYAHVLVTRFHAYTVKMQQGDGQWLAGKTHTAN